MKTRSAADVAMCLRDSAQASTVKLAAQGYGSTLSDFTTSPVVSPADAEPICSGVGVVAS